MKIAVWQLQPLFTITISLLRHFTILGQDNGRKTNTTMHWSFADCASMVFGIIKQTEHNYCLL